MSLNGVTFNYCADQRTTRLLLCSVLRGQPMREAPMASLGKQRFASRRFPPPWQVEQAPGGFKVFDANGQALAYIYARETKAFE
jgi:hypothetical protein